MIAVRQPAALLVEVALTAIALAASLAWLAPRPQTHGEDLVQDYLSARAFRAGDDPYQPLQPLREREGLAAAGGIDMKAAHNPHPPAAVLFTLPVAGLAFERAYLVSQSIQIALLSIAWVWACGLSEIRGVVSAVGGGFVLGLWPPVWGGLDWGQPIGLLGILAVGQFHLAGARRPATSGLLFGIACLVRPFFAGVAAVAGGWRMRDIVVAAVSTVGVVAALFLVAGVTPWEWYQRAAQASRFASMGGSITAVFNLPVAIANAGYLLWMGVVALLAYRGLPGRAAAALGLTGGLLWYPLAWFHYDVVLLPIIAWAASTAVRRRHWIAVIAVAACVAMRFVPPYGGIAGSMSWVPMLGRTLLLAACALLASARAVHVK